MLLPTADVVFRAIWYRSERYIDAMRWLMPEKH